jgi:ribosome assembly protein 1
LDKITYAFQLATSQGPLCNEPIQGIAVFLEEVHVDAPSGEDFGRLTGEVIKTVRESIRQGFLDWSPRMLLAMYSCEIQASSKQPSPLPFPRRARYMYMLKPLAPQPTSSARSTPS